MLLADLLGKVVSLDASDLYLKADTPPTYRVSGETVQDLARLSPMDVERLAYAVMGDEQQVEFARANEMNLAFNYPELGRFRCNIYRQRGTVGIVFRRVKTQIPNVEELNLPPILNELVLDKRGLILVVGSTGSGKSTTLAAMLNHRNETEGGHIITIEDPIEFVHRDKKAIVSQREIGIDTEAYGSALKNALRQAPDVILIGEMRDIESVSAAVYFAETGHLVLSTLHSTNAFQAIERMLQFYPGEMHPQILMQLSLNLKAIISQRLIPRADGNGRVAAIEIMLVTPRIKDLIKKGEINQIRGAIQTGSKDGLQSFEQALYELYTKDLITFDDAMAAADSANDLRLRMKGMTAM
ncbi:MAG: type IV pili twitching motility protein PilT [candidate division SR1 bacterium CG_4_9_14_3_um_filter_40_9]|nr:MAG: type IV pili twitching motility protein PilT [candidate division SR1 bacterium CG_4_9_14_3_um_filter_40_9]